jgi:hypothetical protein
MIAVTNVCSLLNLCFTDIQPVLQEHFSGLWLGTYVSALINTLSTSLQVQTVFYHRRISFYLYPARVHMRHTYHHYSVDSWNF